jgi:hypothetical protein
MIDLHPGDIVTRKDDIRSRYVLLRSTPNAVLQRVEWNSDKAEWVKPEGSVPFVAPAKWELVRPGLAAGK